MVRGDAVPAVGPPRGTPAGEAPSELRWARRAPAAGRVPRRLERLRAPGPRPLRPPGDTEVFPSPGEPGSQPDFPPRHGGNLHLVP